MIKKFAMAVCAAVTLLSCVYPVYDGDAGALVEGHSVWQYLNVYSIYRDRVPVFDERLTPAELFDIIDDTLRGGRYTAYYYPSPPGGGPTRPPAITAALSEATAYFDFYTFDEAALDSFRVNADYLSGYENIIIDLRNNGGGYLSVVSEMVNEFLPPASEYIRYRYRRYDGAAQSGVTVVEDIKSGNPAPRLSGKNIALIVNGGSASASEILVSALKDRAGARIIGSKTYGKGIGQLIIPRYARDSLLITFMEIEGVTQRTGYYHRTGIETDPVPEAHVSEAESMFPYYDGELLSLFNEDPELFYETAAGKYNINPGLYLLYHRDPDMYHALKILEPSITSQAAVSNGVEQESAPPLAKRQAVGQLVKTGEARRSATNSLPPSGAYIITPPDPLVF